MLSRCTVKFCKVPLKALPHTRESASAVSYHVEEIWSHNPHGTRETLLLVSAECEVIPISTEKCMFHASDEYFWGRMLSDVNSAASRGPCVARRLGTLCCSLLESRASNEGSRRFHNHSTKPPDPYDPYVGVSSSHLLTFRPGKHIVLIDS